MAGPNYRVDWAGVQAVAARDYTCGYCGREVSSAAGWNGQGRFLSADGGAGAADGNAVHRLVICPRCGLPTYLRNDTQVPGRAFGEDVEHLPDEVSVLYQEARRSVGENNFNAAVMVSRKLLMNIAVTKGAEPGGTFKTYVDYLEQQGVVTAEMKGWVDEIRELGNDANHELTHMRFDEADAIVTFVAMLLKLVYEYPERGRLSVEARAARAAEQTSDPT